MDVMLKLDGFMGVEAVAELPLGEDDVEIVARVVDTGLPEEDIGLEEMLTKAIAKLHKALAFLGFVGELHVYISPPLDEQDAAEMKRAVEKLSEREKLITPEDVLRVHQEVASENARTVEGLNKLIRFMGEEGLKRGLNKEERGKLTLGEILNDPEE